MPNRTKNYILFDDEYINVRFLDWDTEYFEVQSGKVTLKKSIENYSKDVLNKCIKQFQFTNITNMDNDAYNNKYIGENTTAFLVDTNVQYEKVNRKFDPDATQKKEIQNIIKDQCEYDQAIVDIASNAFAYSRFINDPNINREAAYQLYAKWVINAFEKKNKYFISSYNNDICIAFLLFSVESDNSIRIELLAVIDQFRKQQIGQGVIKTLEKFAITNGNPLIKVGTQLDNILSNNFYPKQGFSFVSSHSIYHYWA